MSEDPQPSWLGRFITFEGMDGAGKTTQIEALSRYLNARNIPHIKTREPGGCPISEDLRKLLLSEAAKNITPVTQALLMAGARAEHIAKTIEPALARGAWVLCDRFMDSTTVYQGYVQNMPLTQIQKLHNVSVGSFVPDLTFVFKLSPDEAKKRIAQKNDNHFDARGLDFQQQVQTGFLDLAQKAPNRFIVIDGNLDAEQVTNAITNALQPHLQNHAAI